MLEKKYHDSTDVCNKSMAYALKAKIFGSLQEAIKLPDDLRIIW